MIFLREALLDEMRAHIAAYPDIEACGLLCAKRDLDRPERLYPMANIANSREFFQFDSQEQFLTFQEIDRSGYRLSAVFHSHIGTEAYPSKTDRTHLANMGNTHQIILSHYPSEQRIDVRSFLISRDIVLEERIKIIH